MKSALSKIAVIAPLTLAVSLAFAAGREPAPKEKPTEKKPITVTAVTVAAAPTLDGDAKDAIWKTAPVTKLNAVKGCNFKGGKTSATLQVAYDKENIYMLVTYDDPTLSVQRSPYKKQADGSWQKLKDPDDKGGDNCVYYEDKLAVLWNINKSIVGFEKFGCDLVQHLALIRYPFRKHYIESRDPVGDDHHHLFIIDIVNIPHLAVVDILLSGKVVVGSDDYVLHTFLCLLIISFISISLDDLCNELVPYDIPFVEVDEIHPGDIFQDFRGMDKP